MRWYWIAGIAASCLVIVVAVALLLDVGSVRSRLLGTPDDAATTGSETYEAVSIPQASLTEGQTTQRLTGVEEGDLSEDHAELEQQKEEFKAMLQNVQNLVEEYRQYQTMTEDLRKELEELKRRQDQLAHENDVEQRKAVSGDEQAATRMADKELTKLARGIEDNPKEGAKILAGMLEQETLKPRVLAILRKLDQNTMMEVLAKLSEELPGESRDVADLIQELLDESKG